MESIKAPVAVQYIGHNKYATRQYLALYSNQIIKQK